MSRYGLYSRAMTVICIALFLSAGCSTPTADSPSSNIELGTTTVRELKKIVDSAASESGVAGGQVSVILGEQRADFVWGAANAELEIPMTVDTIIQIGSTTKVFNAAMIMTLVEEGKLDLDEPVKTYIPDLDISDEEAERSITLRQLLSMTSGLDNGPYTRHGGGEDALSRYVASLKDIPQAFSPGKGYGYSNAGTSIAGHAAERVTGKNWDMLLATRILGPAAIVHAASRPQIFPFLRVSAGHTPGKNGQPPAVIRPWYITQSQGPAGSTLAVSARDLASFGTIFLNDGVASNGERILSDSAVTIMTTPLVKVPSRSYTEHWCIGLEREHWSSTPVYGHAGGNMSGTSYLKIFPEKQGVLALTCNTPAAFGGFTERIFDAFGPAVFEAERAKLKAPDPPVTLENPERFAGRYTMYGASYEVTVEGGSLTMKVTQQNPRGEPIITDYTLVPLGDDAFLMERPESQTGRTGDVGFFGDDGKGRATNLVASVFPAKRVD